MKNIILLSFLSSSPFFLFASVAQISSADLIAAFSMDSSAPLQPAMILHPSVIDAIATLSNEEMEDIGKNIMNKFAVDIEDITVLQRYFKDISFLNSYEKFHPDDYQTSLFFGAIASLYLKEIGDTYESALHVGAINKKSPESLYIYSRLWDFNYGVEMPICNVCKLMTYIREGRWEYIWMKFTSTYLKEFIGVCFIATTSLFLFFILLYHKSRGFRSLIQQSIRRSYIQKYLINKKLRSMGVTNIHKFATLLLIVLITTFSTDVFANEFKTHCELLKLSEKIDKQHSIVQFFYSTNSSQMNKLTAFEQKIIKSKKLYSEFGLASPHSFADRMSCGESLIDYKVYHKYEAVLSQLNSLYNGEEKEVASNIIESNEEKKKLSNSKSKKEVFQAKMKTQGYYVSSIKHDKKSYSFVIVDLNSDSVELDFFLDSKPNKTATFKKAIKEDVKIILNAGMYTTEKTPLGLYVRNGVESTALNTSEGEGNFYLKPNGIFLIDSIDRPMVLSTSQFIQNKDSIAMRHATQSGPMLLIDGKMHPEFTKDSPNFHIRNGVGITATGKAVFVISNEPVRFYQIATLFKDYFKCKNALYLDGFISKMYAPEIGKSDTKGKFGPLITISSTKH